MSVRLAAHVEVSALIRRAESLGGNAAVIRRGDRDAGAILVLLAERGGFLGILERSLAADGRYGWRYRSAEEVERKQSVNDYLARRSEIDADLWLVELDIPRAERFAAQMAAEG